MASDARSTTTRGCLSSFEGRSTATAAVVDMKGGCSWVVSVLGEVAWPGSGEASQHVYTKRSTALTRRGSYGFMGISWVPSSDLR
jgi:hypothetical protein